MCRAAELRAPAPMALAGPGEGRGVGGALPLPLVLRNSLPLLLPFPLSSSSFAATSADWSLSTGHSCPHTDRPGAPPTLPHLHRPWELALGMEGGAFCRAQN